MIVILIGLLFIVNGIHETSGCPGNDALYDQNPSDQLSVPQTPSEDRQNDRQRTRVDSSVAGIAGTNSRNGLQDLPTSSWYYSGSLSSRIPEISPSTSPSHTSLQYPLQCFLCPAGTLKIQTETNFRKHLQFKHKEVIPKLLKEGILSFEKIKQGDAFRRIYNWEFFDKLSVEYLSSLLDDYKSKEVCKFFCGTCEGGFVKPGEYRKHCIERHNGVSRQIQASVSPPETAISYPSNCFLCSSKATTFENASAFKRHLQFGHKKAVSKLLAENLLSFRTKKLHNGVRKYYNWEVFDRQSADHLRQVLQEFKEKEDCQLSCSICHEHFTEYPRFLAHQKQAHNGMLIRISEPNVHATGRTQSAQPETVSLVELEVPSSPVNPETTLSQLMATQDAQCFLCDPRYPNVASSLLKHHLQISHKDEVKKLVDQGKLIVHTSGSEASERKIYDWTVLNGMTIREIMDALNKEKTNPEGTKHVCRYCKFSFRTRGLYRGHLKQNKDTCLAFVRQSKNMKIGSPFPTKIYPQKIRQM